MAVTYHGLGGFSVCCKDATLSHTMLSRQITIIPKPELRGFWGDSLTKPPFGVTNRFGRYKLPIWRAYTPDIEQLKTPFLTPFVKPPTS